MLWRRERALSKLMMCEEDLLNSITAGKEKYILVLRKHCTLTTPVEISILFGNMEEVSMNEDAVFFTFTIYNNEVQ